MLCVTPLGFCLRTIVNEKPPNLKKPTSSFLSILLLIYEVKKLKTNSNCNALYFCYMMLKTFNISSYELRRIRK